MVVNKTTAVLYLIALSLSGFIHTFLRAEERGIYDDGNDSNLLIVFYVQIMPDDFVMQLHRF